MARETWTDKHLDDLKAGMDAGFREQREETRALRAEMQAGDASLRAEIQAGDSSLRAEMQAGFARLDARIDRLQLIMIATLLTVVLGIVVDKL